MADYYGYAGRTLFVNLTSSEIKKVPLDMADAGMYLGGLGLNNKIAFDNIESGTDALAPENPIILGAGPLIGTMTPGASRTVCISKFPLSGAVSAGSGSMTFGFNMKRAGYDNIVVTGASDRGIRSGTIFILWFQA